jgi:hypothetical protein
VGIELNTLRSNLDDLQLSLVHLSHPGKKQEVDPNSLLTRDQLDISSREYWALTRPPHSNRTVITK